MFCRRFFVAVCNEVIEHSLVVSTCAAKSALRGEAALRARLPREVKKNASISPCDREINGTRWLLAYDTQMCERHPPCVGDLLQLTEKGNRHSF